MFSNGDTTKKLWTGDFNFLQIWRKDQEMVSEFLEVVVQQPLFSSLLLSCIPGGGVLGAG